MDWDIILVSSHLGARVTDSEDFTNHYWWQGQFYSRTGRDKRFKPYSVCGQGHVQGIHGANCRHSHGPGDGEHNPFAHYDSEENKKEYELQQKQREMERRIRETKSHLMGYKKALENSPTEKTRKVTEEKYQKKAALLKKQNEAYTAFCKENDLKPLNERLAVAKWDRKQAAQAREAAKKASIGRNEIATPGNFGEKAVPYTDRGIAIEKRISNYMKSLNQNSDYIELPEGEIKNQDLSVLTTETGVEYSLLTINQKNYLIRGEEKKTTIPAHLVQSLIENEGTFDCHSHPYIGDLIPSDADKDFLKRLTWQKESVIIDPIQNTAVFTAEGLVSVEKEEISRNDEYYATLFGGD